jgi:CheY-like chemotaxis protein
MVVDDEAPIRLITQQTLEAFGYRVLLASDGSEAISTYVQHQHDIVVVLTDMMMPVMDGPSTIRVLRRLNPRLHIIAMSGIDADGKGAKAVRSGANAFLTKPYAADVLLKTIHDVLADKRKAAESRNEAT